MRLLVSTEDIFGFQHRGFTTHKGKRVLMRQIFMSVLAVFLFGFGNDIQCAESKLKGLTFFDYYYIASGPDKKENGFRFRRVYLTYDLKWNDDYSGLVRLEAKDAGFGNTSKMKPFVKHAYLRYKKNSRAVYFGLFGTPTWNVSEQIWGYSRSPRRSWICTKSDLPQIWG